MTCVRAYRTARQETPILVEERVPGRRPARRPPRNRRVSRTTVEDTISGEGLSRRVGRPLAEADFHMAYGLYDQAADLVQVRRSANHSAAT